MRSRLASSAGLLYEVASASPHLPDAVVGELPCGLDELRELAGRHARALFLGQAETARLVQCLDHLAVDVELELVARSVADAHRARLLIAW